MVSGEIKELIEEKKKELEEKYPIEAMYNSRQTLWARGLDDGIVDIELYNKASKYYGSLWTYVGDW